MDFGKYMQTLQYLPQLPMLVNNTVIEMENMLSGIPGISGSQKLAAVEAKVNTILSELIQDAGVLSELKGVIVMLINGAVAAFNAAKLFSKSSSSTK